MLFTIFKIFFKLGFVAFGGGYSVIAMLENEVVDKHNLIDRERFFNMVYIGQGLPGAIALNVAIFVGYFSRGIKGAVVAALGSVLPSLIIISGIMILFSNVSTLAIVKSAMNGIRPVVVALICFAAYRVGIRAYKSKGYAVLTVIGLFICLFASDIPLPLIIVGGLLCGLLINFIQAMLKSGDVK